MLVVQNKLILFAINNIKGLVKEIICYDRIISKI